MIDIAIIDDGVNHGRFSIGSLFKSIEILDDLSIRDYTPSNIFSFSHGTVCAGIINEVDPKARLTSIKIINSDGRGCVDKLVVAIKWAIKNKINICNISLGSIYSQDICKLESVVLEAKKNQVILVAACSNDFNATFPAYFSSVVGVTYSPNDNLNECSIEKDCHVGWSQLISVKTLSKLNIYNGETYNVPLVNSYAAPIITAQLSKMLLLEGIEAFYNFSNKFLNNNANIKNCSLDWIENPILFYLVRGNKKLPLNNLDIDISCIVYLYDENSFFEDIYIYLKRISFRYKSIIIIADSQFDNNYCNLDIVKNYCYNIVLIDTKNRKLKNTYLPQENGKLWHPDFFPIENMNSSMNIEIDAPVIVLSFSEHHLLDLFQYILSKFLKNDGYEPLVLSNSSTSILYNTTVLNNKLNMCLQISKWFSYFKPDLIILAISPIIPIDYNALNNDIEIDLLIIDEEFSSSSSLKSEEKMIIENNSLNLIIQETDEQSWFYDLYNQIIEFFSNN